MSTQIQIQDLLRTGFVLKRDFKNYTLNGREITAEEYDELWNGVLIFLDNNCEKVDEYEYGIEDVMSARVVMYKCDSNKIGLFLSSSEGYDVFRVYSGDGSWREVKDIAIDDIEAEIEWLEPIENTDEIIEYLNEAIDEIKHMPE